MCCCMHPMQTLDTPLTCKYLSKWNEHNNLTHKQLDEIFVLLARLPLESICIRVNDDRLQRANDVYCWWRMHLTWKWIYCRLQWVTQSNGAPPKKNASKQCRCTDTICWIGCRKFSSRMLFAFIPTNSLKTIFSSDKMIWSESKNYHIVKFFWQRNKLQWDEQNKTKKVARMHAHAVTGSYMCTEDGTNKNCLLIEQTKRCVTTINESKEWRENCISETKEKKNCLKTIDFNLKRNSTSIFMCMLFAFVACFFSAVDPYKQHRDRSKFIHLHSQA